MRALTLLGVVAFALPTSSSLAQGPRESLIVSPTWLASHINDQNLVILHVGARAQYDSAHVPGARFVSLDDISVSDRSGNGLSLEMPTADDLRQRLAAIGISDNSRIVVYHERDRITTATRALFTLDYAGLGAASSLLDGGIEAWKRSGNSVTQVVPASKVGTLSALKLRPIVVTAEDVAARRTKPHVAIVDARAAEYYDGTQVGGRGSQRAGHVDGARSVPYTSVTDSVFRLRPATELEALFANAGVQRGDTVIAYCHIGQQATATLFAARSLGHPVLLYDGSFEDWSRRSNLPVEKKP